MYINISKTHFKLSHFAPSLYHYYYCDEGLQIYRVQRSRHPATSYTRRPSVTRHTFPDGKSLCIYKYTNAAHPRPYPATTQFNGTSIVNINRTPTPPYIAHHPTSIRKRVYKKSQHNFDVLSFKEIANHLSLSFHTFTGSRALHI